MRENTYESAVMFLYKDYMFETMGNKEISEQSRKNIVEGLCVNEFCDNVLEDTVAYCEKYGLTDIKDTIEGMYSYQDSQQKKGGDKTVAAMDYMKENFTAEVLDTIYSEVISNKVLEIKEQGIEY